MLSSVYKAPGSLPFFGHALRLASHTPWDQMATWAWEARSKKNADLVVVDFFAEVFIAAFFLVTSGEERNKTTKDLYKRPRKSLYMYIARAE